MQLTAPDRVPGFYGFSPDPKPELVARYQTDAPAVAVTRPLERDRAVDETGGQIAVFGRLGAGLYQDDMRSLVFDENGALDRNGYAGHGGHDSPRTAAGGHGGS